MLDKRDIRESVMMYITGINELERVSAVRHLKSDIATIHTLCNLSC